MFDILFNILAIGGFLIAICSGWNFFVFALVAVVLYGLHIWCQGPNCSSDSRLDGKTVVITGANTGIGKETAKELSRRGARIIMGCRNLQKGENALQEIKNETKGQVIMYPLDLASFKSVRNFVDKVLQSEKHGVHILINNAGVMLCPFSKTEDGNEMHFQINHLSHFLMTNLMLPLLKASSPARIINVSSFAHFFARGGFKFENVNSEQNYGKINAYAQSKLANILFTKSLAKKLKGTGVTVYSLHPGTVNTELGRYVDEMLPSFLIKLRYYLCCLIFKTPISGAQTTLQCALDKQLADESGKYYSDCTEEDASDNSKDENVQNKLWELSEKLTALSSSDVEKKVKVIDIQDVPLPPLPDDATPESETMPEFPSDDESDIKNSKLVPLETKSKETGKQEDLLSELNSFNKDSLAHQNVQNSVQLPTQTEIELEKAEIEIDTQKSKDLFDSVKTELISETPVLKEIETKVKESLPDKYDLLTEKTHQDIVNQVENFEPTQLAHVKTKEPMKPTELAKRDVVLQEIEKFDTDGLKNIPQVDNVHLPDTEEINQEKAIINEETSKNKVLFEQVTTELESSSPDLKKTEVVIKDTLPDKYDLLSEKVHTNIMSEVSSFEPKELSHVEWTEPAGLPEFVKKDIVFQDIQKFNSDSLKPVKHLDDQVRLPKLEDIQLEKEVISHETSKNKSLFDQVTQEIKSGDLQLKETDISVKNSLPDKYEILSEKVHLDILDQVSDFEVKDLHHVITQEPVTPADFIKKDNVLEEINTFDSSDLKSVETQDTNRLPSLDDIEREKEYVSQDINKNKKNFTEVTKEIESVQPVLNKVEVKVKENLPDKYDLLSEKVQPDILSEMTKFDTKSLTPVKTQEPINPKDFLNKDVLNQDIQEYNTNTLAHVNTMEPFTPKDYIQREAVVSEIKDFDTAGLKNPSVSYESTYVPSQKDIEDELIDIQNGVNTSKKTFEPVLSEVQSFETEQLNKVTTHTSENLPDKFEISREKSMNEIAKEVEQIGEDRLKREINLLESSTNNPESGSSGGSSGEWVKFDG